MRTAYRLTKVVWLATLVSAWLLSPSPSIAQPNGNYRELVRKALVAFDAKHWDEARALFQAAHQLEPNARTLRGLGMVAFEMEDFVGAYRLLRQSLGDSRRALDGSLREQTEALLKRTRLLIGRLRVSVTPEEAALKLDGESIQADEDVWLNIGLHVLIAEAQGFEQKKLSLDVRNGDDQQLDIELDPIPLVASVGPTATEREVASQRVTASLNGQPGRAPQEDDSIVRKWWFWAGAGGLVVVGVGAVLLAQSGEPSAKAPTKGTGGVVITALSLQ